MQDQCGFTKDNGEYLTEHDYTDNMQTNADRYFKEHGSWCTPVFPAVRTLQGSVPTPYIFDDIVDYNEVADAIHQWYLLSKEEIKLRGKLGREFLMLTETGLSAPEMGNRFIASMNNCFENWTLRNRFELHKI